MQHGTDVDVQDTIGNSPIQRAAVFGHTAIIQCLIEHGANVNIRPNAGRTPLDWAVNRNHQSAADLPLPRRCESHGKRFLLSVPEWGKLRRGFELSLSWRSGENLGSVPVPTRCQSLYNRETRFGPTHRVQVRQSM